MGTISGSGGSGTARGAALGTALGTRFRRWSRVGFALALTVVAAACGGGRPQLPPVTPSPTPLPVTPTPAAAAGPAFVLLEPGSEPREAVRLDVVPTQQALRTLRLSTTVESVVNGAVQPVEELPSTEYTVRAQVTGVEGAQVTMTVQADRAVVPEDDPAPDPDGLAGTVGALAGTGVQLVLDDRGLPLDQVVTVPEGLAPELAPLAGQLSAVLQTLLVPFPVEPIGVGARWRATTSFERQDLVITQTTTYQLTSRERTRYTLAGMLEQSAEPQQFFLNPSTIAQLESLTARGTINVSWDLTEPLPGRSRETVLRSQTMRVTEAGATDLVERRTTTDVELRQ